MAPELFCRLDTDKSGRDTDTQKVDAPCFLTPKRAQNGPKIVNKLVEKQYFWPFKPMPKKKKQVSMFKKTTPIGKGLMQAVAKKTLGARASAE